MRLFCFFVVVALFAAVCRGAALEDNLNGLIDCVSGGNEQCKDDKKRTVVGAEFSVDCQAIHACENSKLVVRRGSTLIGDIACAGNQNNCKKMQIVVFHSDLNSVDSYELDCNDESSVASCMDMNLTMVGSKMAMSCSNENCESMQVHLFDGSVFTIRPDTALNPFKGKQLPVYAHGTSRVIYDPKYEDVMDVQYIDYSEITTTTVEPTSTEMTTTNKPTVTTQKPTTTSIESSSTLEHLETTAIPTETQPQTNEPTEKPTTTPKPTSSNEATEMSTATPIVTEKTTIQSTAIPTTETQTATNEASEKSTTGTPNPTATDATVPDSTLLPSDGTPEKPTTTMNDTNGTVMMTSTENSDDGDNDTVGNSGGGHSQKIILIGFVIVCSLVIVCCALTLWYVHVRHMKPMIASMETRLATLKLEREMREAMPVTVAIDVTDKPVVVADAVAVDAHVTSGFDEDGSQLRLALRNVDKMERDAKDSVFGQMLGDFNVGNDMIAEDVVEDIDVGETEGEIGTTYAAAAGGYGQRQTAVSVAEGCVRGGGHVTAGFDEAEERREQKEALRKVGKMKRDEKDEGFGQMLGSLNVGNAILEEDVLDEISGVPPTRGR